MFPAKKKSLVVHIKVAYPSPLKKRKMWANVKNQDLKILVLDSTSRSWTGGSYVAGRGQYCIGHMFS